MALDKDKADNDLDWEHRILCSDESCIGIIGMDGRCRECGKIFQGKLPENFGVTSEDDVYKPDLSRLGKENLLEEEDKIENSEEILENELDKIDPDWEKRILCSDESCIGVIGPDGRCKECGRPYEELNQSISAK